MKIVFKIFFALFLILTASTSFASMIPIPFEQRVADADYIVHGKVVEITARYEQFSQQATVIMSTIKIDIVENLKGDLTEEEVIKSFGGTLDGAVSYLSISPVFHQGDEIVLFLKKYGNELFPLYHQQGVFFVKDGFVSAFNGESVSELKKQIKDNLK